MSSNADRTGLALCRLVMQCMGCVDLSPACPVFLPPLPLLQTPEAYLESWKGREIWLDVAPEQATYRITESGCAKLALDTDGDFSHTEADLCCDYGIAQTEDVIYFHVRQDIAALVRRLEGSAVTCLVGLYQQLG